MKFRLACIIGLCALSSCDWIGRQADALGEHMPVIGERCDHWQCVTESGKEKSDAIKAAEAKQQQQLATPNTKGSKLPTIPDSELPAHPLITAPPQ